MFGQPSDAAETPVATPRDPLLLLADPIAGPAMWDGLAPLLAEGFDVVREPPGRRATTGATELAGDAAAWVEAELLTRNLYPVHLVATGFAGGAAIRVARERPELLRSLVLHAPVVRFGPGAGEGAPAWAEVTERFQSVADAIDRGDGISARRAWRTALHPSPATSAASVGVAVGVEPGQRRWRADWADLRGWTISEPADLEFLPPVLILEGAEAPPFLHRIAGELARGFPNVTRLRLPEAGALLPEEDPRRLAGVLFSFCLERNVPTA